MARRYGLTVACVAGASMQPAFQDGDLVLGIPVIRLRLGDVVLCRENSRGLLVIHRIAAITTGKIVTRGDNNPASVTETVTAEQIDARVIFRIPCAGSWVRWVQRQMRGAYHGHP